MDNTVITTMVLSKECNPVVGARCEKLGIVYYQDLDNKAATLQSLLATRNIDARHVIYVGQDMNDLECIQMQLLMHTPIYFLMQKLYSTRSGHGTVRELCEMIMSYSEIAVTLRIGLMQNTSNKIYLCLRLLLL